MTRNWLRCAALSAATILAAVCGNPAQAQVPDAQAASAVLKQYCVTCHNAQLRTAGFVIEPAGVTSVGANAENWEKVVQKLRSQSMPPNGLPRPDVATYKKVATYLEKSLDANATAHLNPGTMPHLHRLTRTEYKNAVRDLLGLDNLPKEMDFEELLPADNSASGFDNLADLLFVSPVIMQRYLDAAGKISRLAVGDMKMPELVNIHHMPLQVPQDIQQAELPLGTRGGLAIHSYFPLDAEYTFTIETAGNGRDQHQLEVSIDGVRVQVIPVGGGGRGPRGAKPPEVRAAVKAGPHDVAVTFVQKDEALEETTLRLSTRGHGSLPAINEVTIRGPFKPTGPGVTPSRERILICHPENEAAEAACAKKILTSLARYAYRRPATDTDLTDLMPFYEAGRKDGSFDAGIQRVVERLLVSPQFLYRIERDPATTTGVYRVSDVELASRISFFLWSSIPDDELLNLAAKGRLHDPLVLEQQTKRMLADKRSEALVNNFAAQWLYLRDVEGKDPDLFLFRYFDGVLKSAFEKETDLFVNSVLRENHSVLELLTANYTYLNERLAKHYGIPNVRGAYFRKVTLPPDSPRGGLLGQGSILTLTSYSTRTSPVLRGKYVLENLLASPPPPPPPNVPALKTENETDGKPLTMREAMEKHRAVQPCASCHARMDPIGFAMENFDAVGQWRDIDAGAPINSAGVLPDGQKINGVADLKKALIRDPERFVTAITDKLMMYALGRNVQYYDTPAVRAVVRKAAASQYTFESLVEGVVKSVPFQMRVKDTEKDPAPAEAAKRGAVH